MKNKQKYILKILRKHGILVNFTGEPKKKNLPSKIDGENFKQWISRILGDDVSNVQIYMPAQPHGNFSMERLSDISEIDFVKDILRASLKMKDEEKQEELNLADQEYKDRVKAQRVRLKKKTEEKIKKERENFATIGTDTLYDILNNIDDLQPSVREFLQSFISNDEANIDTETLLTKLIERHNYAAKTVQELKAACAGTIHSSLNPEE